MNTNVDSYISSQIEWKSSILKDLRECIHSADPDGNYLQLMTPWEG